MFRALCAHHPEVKLYYTASGIITPVGGRPVHRLREDIKIKWIPYRYVSTTYTLRQNYTNILQPAAFLILTTTRQQQQQIEPQILLTLIVLMWRIGWAHI